MARKKTFTNKKETVRDFRVEDLEKDENGEVILPEDITYPELVHLAHPELSADELSRKITQEKRMGWLVRFMVVALLAILVLIIALIVTNPL